MEIELNEKEIETLRAIANPPAEMFGPTSKTLFRLGLLETAENFLEPLGLVEEFDYRWQLTAEGEAALLALGR